MLMDLLILRSKEIGTLMNDESFVIARKQCPKCASIGHDNSQDNLAKYSDGHGYCYRCKYYEKGKKMSVPRKTVGDWTPLYGECESLPERKLTEETLRKFSYQLINHPDKGCIHVANFYVDGSLVAQKYRGPDKKFKWRGESRSAGLFGQHLFDGSNSRRLVITEGEIDAMSVYQVNGGWPVVSLNGGTGNAENNIKDNLEWIAKFPEIVLMFDQDDAGRKAAVECSQLLPPGRVKIAALPHKDANECLLSNDSKSIVNAIFQAKLYSPDEILHVKDIPESADTSMEVYAYPWDGLSEFLLGQRSKEVSLWCSGTGSGKSTILREIANHHLEEGRSVGMLMLEEAPEETRDDMISLLINKPVRAIRATKVMNELRQKMGKDPISIEFFDDLNQEEYAQAREHLENTNLYIYDHLGNSAMQNIMARMEYMAVSLEVDVIVLDHITALAAGLMGNQDDDNNQSERILIDTVMKQLRALSVRTGVHIDIVSQLKKTDKAFEEGNRITLQDLRGSGSLSSVPNTIIALERDRQADCEFEANTTIVRVLKNRLTGRAGIAACLYYDRKRGRLSETDFQIAEGNVVLDPNKR